MKIRLERSGETGPIVHLRGRISDAGRQSTQWALRYRTRTGALLRIAGRIAGAFDREHAMVPLPIVDGPFEIELDVERRSLPTWLLPSRPGLRWWLMQRRAQQTPRLHAELLVTPSPSAQGGGLQGGLPLIGHAHLDIAWLWTYAEGRRKAARTFATAARQIRADPRYVFTQSMPQSYTFVEEDEPELFGRVAAFARAGRFDASGAALWCESDCNLPSGESLLRQLTFGVRYAQERLGTSPCVAWLPDSFGFANTLPTLLTHAGIAYFATTKLCWNDTTRFPYPQFWWEGPDGSRVLSALIASYVGGTQAWRVQTARRRREPLLLGYGDGGGGATDAMLANASRLGRWTTLGGWFDRLALSASALPIHQDELYLEYHRGVYTTHHDIKARHAALERALWETELLGAWALALRASPFFLAEFRAQLRAAWEIVLRSEYHDILPGSAIGAAYADVHGEYDRADTLVARAAAGARSVLPRSGTAGADAPFVEPQSDGRNYRFENRLLTAVVRCDGTIVELRLGDEKNVVTSANVLRAYVDRPNSWQAWNIDRGYAKRPRKVRATGAGIIDGALEVRYALGASRFTARLSLAPQEPFLRVDVAVDWRERHTLLRCENELPLQQVRARFGTPHGTVERTAYPRSAAERAKFEVPGQRFACVAAPDGRGLAVLTLDTYGWNVSGSNDAVRLGHSLLRGTTWPDEQADLGEHLLSYAFAPLQVRADDSVSIGAIERLWRRFALPPALPMFDCDDESVLVVATKPADDGEGVIVRIRECDGAARDVVLRCAARARSVTCVDALERRTEGDAELRDATIRAHLRPFALRSFRVRFT
ncbi:MAG: alpha-mannosidase [Candidatus Eremiobacteraeota bacterium]|nr:alpha-mannosidase [Candidatus Eremiobacteraeota bacterium]MBC5801802.1 alpha-mannosidase [Candidatus Eremiobacteraeota bacterium]MBC5823132.1 alpha-mannosidase [Candidatus Eremiobacteraeota bacterium]